MYNEQTGYEKDETLRQQDTNCGWGSTQSDLTTFRSFPRYQPDLHADGMFERDILIKKNACTTYVVLNSQEQEHTLSQRPSKHRTAEHPRFQLALGLLSPKLVNCTSKIFKTLKYYNRNIRSNGTGSKFAEPPRSKAAGSRMMRFCTPQLSLVVGIAAVLDPKVVTSSKATQVCTLRPRAVPTSSSETATLAIG